MVLNQESVRVPGQRKMQGDCEYFVGMLSKVTGREVLVMDEAVPEQEAWKGRSCETRTTTTDWLELEATKK